jgi:hypothetical protein
MSPAADPHGDVRQRPLPRYVSPESIAAHDGGFLWLCIPKNASRSLIALLGARGRALGELAPAGGLRAWMKTAELPAWSFAVCRNPYARVVSAWRNKIAAPPDTPAQARLIAENPGLEPGMSLSAFVAWLEEAVARGGPIDHHWSPQSDFICDRSGRRWVSHVARMESLAGDLHAMADRLGGMEDLPWLTRTASRPDDLAGLSVEDRRRIRTAYAADFESFVDE